MRAPLFLISLALSSAACSDGTGYAERAGVETEPTSPTANATPVAAKAQELEEETDRYLFAYGWPAEASAEPGLAKIMKTNPIIPSSNTSSFPAFLNGSWGMVEQTIIV